MIQEFKAFIQRGNVMDLAVAVIIGAAFGKIVSSLVGDVIMPVVGILSGGVDFSGLHVRIGGTAVEPVFLNYGMFIQATVDFLIIAVVIFLMVRVVSRLKKPESLVKPSTQSCPYCKIDIHQDATRCPNCTSDLSVSNRSS